MIQIQSKANCDNCRYLTDLRTYYVGEYSLEHHFCEVCAFTLLSQATTQPHDVDMKLFKSIGWCVNKILGAINDKK